jgi:hypothetical protein
VGNIERDITMSINMNDHQNIPSDPEACYEALASQEEIYLEEVEEVRAILIFDDPPPSRRETKGSMTDPKNSPPLARSLDEQLNQAAEDLITGGPDDPPLSDEAVMEMLTDSPARWLGSGRRPSVK